MTLWARVRRVPTCLLTILGIIVASLFWDDTRFPLPTILSVVEVQFPLVAFLPLVLAIFMAQALSAGNPPLEAVASRPASALDAGYAVAAASSVTFILLTMRVVVDADELAMAGRNSLGYVGLCLIAYRFIGPLLASLVPTAFVIGCTLIGVTQRGAIKWWAWPLAQHNDSLSWAFAVALLALGAMSMALLRDRLHR